MLSWLRGGGNGKPVTRTPDTRFRPQLDAFEGRIVPNSTM